MKAISVMLFLLVLGATLVGSITNFSYLGVGQFGGKPAAYASGDTIVYVIRENNNTAIGAVKYFYSYNGGITWNSSAVVPATVEEYFAGAPSLLYTPEEQLVVTQKHIHKSTNGGTNWQFPPYTTKGTFENAPIIEKRDGSFRMVNAVMPYPEDRQDEFVIPGTDDFAVPQVFTDNFETPNETNAYFYGPDVITGSVRLNSDLKIKQAGGGNNNGWPTFLKPVVIAGEVISIPGAYPTESVFQGGLIENAPVMELPDPGVIRENARIVGPTTPSENRIVYIEGHGTYYDGWVGEIQLPRRVHTDVWPSYPSGTDVDPAFRNNFTVCDTVWTTLPSGSCASRTMLVNSKLWIKGEFAGYQTWMSTDTLYVVGDITLSGTAPGESPSNNVVDWVYLISEKSIVMKYGYRDPADSIRVHPLCAADTNPHMVYASLYALGEGDGNSHKDGVFTFEYQHPHGSIPATSIYVPGQGETLFDWIDLHRNHWTQTPENPWPPLLDYPWYNPLWPEKDPYLERGTILQFGSVVQQRQGYLHRSYYDSEYPSGGVWNPDIDYCGGTSAPNPTTVQLYNNPAVSVTLQTRHFPGATGNGVGYKKQFYTDTRNSFTKTEMLGNEGFWRLGLRLSSFNLEGDTDPIFSDYETYYLLPQTRKTFAKSFARRGMLAAYSVNDKLVSAMNDEVTDISDATEGDGNVTACVVGNDNNFWVNQLAEVDNGYLLTVKQISSATGAVMNTFADIAVPNKLNDLVVLPSGRALLAYYENGVIKVLDISKGDESVFVESWPLQEEILPIICGEESKLYLLPSGNGNVEVFLWIKYQYQTQLLNSGKLYHARASYPVSSDDPVVPSLPQVVVSVYPNPMQSELKLDVKSTAAISPTFEIYNIRGQKIKTLLASSKANEHSLVWDGKDSDNRPVSSGVYLIKAVVDNKVLQTKRICKY